MDTFNSPNPTKMYYKTIPPWCHRGVIRFNELKYWRPPTFQTSAGRAPGFYWAPRWCGWVCASCRTEAAEGDRGSGEDSTGRLAARAAGCHGGGTWPGKGCTFGRERWGGSGTGKWTMSLGPPGARRSWLSSGAGVESASPRAYRATSLAGKSLEREKHEVWLADHFSWGDLG